MLKFIHKIGGPYLKDTVYAANDGIVTTFAIVAGVMGATLSPFVILALGFANLLADGFSMATGNYLGTKSESDHYERERDRERVAFENSAHKGREEVNGILKAKGFSQEDVGPLTALIMKNKEFFLDFVIFERIGIIPSTTSKAIRGALVTFFSFLIAGLIPLLPFVFFRKAEVMDTFIWASIFTGAALFFVGASRTFFSGKSWWVGGLEMFFAGGAAAVIAYVIGLVIRTLINGAL